MPVKKMSIQEVETRGFVAYPYSNQHGAQGYAKYQVETVAGAAHGVPLERPRETAGLLRAHWAGLTAEASAHRS